MEHLRWPASQFILVFQGFVYGSLVIRFSDDLWVPSVHDSDCIQGWNWKYRNCSTKISKISRLSFILTLNVFYSFRCSLLNLDEWFISVRISSNWITEQSIRWRHIPKIKWIFEMSGQTHESNLKQNANGIQWNSFRYKKIYICHTHTHTYTWSKWFKF